MNYGSKTFFEVTVNAVKMPFNLTSLCSASAMKLWST